MPSLKAIRTRITSVKNTRKITRAMKLVSTAKLRRAQEALIAARPYSKAIARVVSDLSVVAGADAHELFIERPMNKVAMVVMTSDRGQAGAFNANVTKAVERYAANELAGATEVSLRIIGRKGNQYFSRRRTTITSFDGAPTGVTALEVAR
jgi:F-type H+-transporting ATPase subunit gamma